MAAYRWRAHVTGFGWEPIPYWAFVVACQLAFAGLLILWRQWDGRLKLKPYEASITHHDPCQVSRRMLLLPGNPYPGSRAGRHRCLHAAGI
jgi:hypothetical protein